MENKEIAPEGIEEAPESAEKKETAEDEENAGNKATEATEETKETEAAEAVEAQNDEIEDDFAVDGDELAANEQKSAADNAETESEPEAEKAAEEITSEEPKEKKPNPIVENLKGIKKLPWKLIGTISGIAVLVLAAIYFAGVWFYSSHFAYNTALKIFECPNMTVEEAEAKIKSGFSDYLFYIFERDNKVESISGKSIDLRCVSVTGIQEALERQNPFAWPFPEAYQDVNITVEFDADKLYHEAEKLDCFAQSIKDMDGAYAGVYYLDGKYHMREVENKNAISFA